MKIRLKHPQSGLLKETKLGFSWTGLFFGVFVPLVRGDLKWTVIMFFLTILTLGLAWIVFPFVYNKVYIKGLLEKGFIPADEESKAALVVEGII